MRIRVEHDDGIGKDVCNVGRRKGVGVAVRVALCKLEHEAIDLLRLAWQPKPIQKAPVCDARVSTTISNTSTISNHAPQGIVKRHVGKIKRVGVGVHDLDGDVLLLAHVLANHRLVQALRLGQKARDFLRRRPDESQLLQQREAFFGLFVEQEQRLLKRLFVLLERLDELGLRGIHCRCITCADGQ